MAISLVIYNSCEPVDKIVEKARKDYIYLGGHKS